MLRVGINNRPSLALVGVWRGYSTSSSPPIPRRKKKGENNTTIINNTTTDTINNKIRKRWGLFGDIHFDDRTLARVVNTSEWILKTFKEQGVSQVFIFIIITKFYSL